MTDNSQNEAYDNPEVWNAQDVLKALVSISTDAVTVQDFDGRILAWNGAAEVMYGYSEAEALGRNIMEFAPEDKHGEVRAWADCLSQDQTVLPFETQRIAKSGRVFDLWLTVCAVRDTSKKARAVVTTDHKITAVGDLESEPQGRTR